MDNSQVEFSDRVKSIIIILVATVLFMEFLDLSIINTAVPTIAKDFMVSPIILKFAVASYYLSLAIFIPISGWCADRFGAKTIFIISIVVFTISSIMCGISTNSVELTFFRFFQGVGGAFMSPVSRIVVLKVFPPKELVKAQSAIFTPALLGVILGPFLGGIITQYLSWHWIFFINIPIGIIAVIVGNKYIQQFKPKTIRPFDWFGFLMVGFTLVLITFFVEMLDHYDIISKSMVVSMGIGGIILFIISIIYCKFKTNSIFDLSVFKINAFSVGFVTNSVVFAMHSGIMFMLPLLFQGCLGYSPAQSGYLVLPIAIMAVVNRSATKIFIDKFGFNNMLKLSSTLILISILGMSFIDKSMPIWAVILFELVYGSAVVMSGGSTGALCYVNTPKDMVSNVASLDLTFRQFFASIGVGLTSFFLTNFAGLLGIQIFTENGTKVFHYTFICFALLMLVPLINSFRLKPVKI